MNAVPVAQPRFPPLPAVKQPLRRASLPPFQARLLTLIVTGALRPHNVANQYRSANVFVHPSANEGLGLVLLEAMSCGLPVIATDRSGAEDCVTNGKDGFVIPARRVEELAEAISWCFHHRLELPAMGMAARNKILRQFTRAHYEERQIALYRSLDASSQAAAQHTAALS